MAFMLWLGDNKTLPQFASKLALLILLAGSLNHLRELIVDWDNPNSFFRSLSDAAFVTVPIGLLFLWLLKRVVAMHRELLTLATTDQLTGLPNRRAFFDTARPEEQPSGPPIVGILDIDHFKLINDEYGHVVGDHVLRGMGAMIRSRAHPEMTYCRYGGEEFACIVPHLTMQQTVALASEYSKGMTLRVDDLAIPSTSSIGLAEWTSNLTLEEALRKADRALYRAKSDGRARAYAYSRDTDGTESRAKFGRTRNSPRALSA